MSAPAARTRKRAAEKPRTKTDSAAPAAAAPQPQHGAPTIAAFNGGRAIPTPMNEPIRSYAPGSPERKELKARLRSMSGERIDIPLVIDGRDVRTGNTAATVMPHDHHHVLGDYHLGRCEARD